MDGNCIYEIPHIPVCFKAEGRDVVRYLQNRLSQDIRSLKERPVWAGALTAQGKTELLLQIFQHDKSTYLYCEPPVIGEESEKIILRYKVADDIKLYAAGFIKAVHITASLPAKEDALAIPRKRFHIEGTDLLHNYPTTDDFLNSAEELKQFLDLPRVSHEEAEFKRIENKIPAYPTEISPTFILAESGFHDSYSTHKGCYVGQEVLQKIDSFAALPFSQVALQSVNEVTVAPGDTVTTADGQEAGKVLSSARHDGKTACFVRVKKSLPAKNYIINQIEFNAIP